MEIKIQLLPTLVILSKVRISFLFKIKNVTFYYVFWVAEHVFSNAGSSFARKKYWKNIK